MHRWNASALTRPLFTDQDFTATKFSSAAEKAGFANTLLRFIETDFRPTLFTQRLYSRLSMCFGHIAHTNQLGFSETFFDDLQGKVAFLEQTLAWRCYGQPDYTYCDVEHAIQSRLHACGLLAVYRARHAAEIESSERAMLARLLAKYDGVPAAPPIDPPILRPMAPPRLPRAVSTADQPSLL